MSELSVEIQEKAILMTRPFAAAPEDVFAAYTSCEVLKQWFGPHQWPIEECELDFREGGAWHFCMREQDGSGASWNLVTYLEIEDGKRILYEDSFSDEQRSKLPPVGRVEIQFRPQDGGGTLLWTRNEYESNETRDTVLEMGVEAGVAETFDRLEEYLAST